MVAELNTILVRAERVDGWWMLTARDVPGVVSQVRKLSQAEEYAREAISFALDVPRDSFTVDVCPVVEGLQELIDDARESLRTAEAAQRDAAAKSRAVVAALTEVAKLSGAEAAAVLGISPQRVSQLRKSRLLGDGGGVTVTSAQVNAAKLKIKRSVSSGRAVSPSVQAIADATRATPSGTRSKSPKK